MATPYVLSAVLINHPSEIAAIRSVALMASVNGLFGVVEAEDEVLDLYWHYFKSNYLTDFFKEFVRPAESPIAIRIDISNNFPYSIITDRIAFQNAPSIIGQLEYLKRLQKTLALRG